MSGWDQAVAEICPKLSECTHCLGVTWNAQATIDTFCGDYGRYASSRILCVSTAATAYLRVQLLLAAAREGIDVKCCRLRGTREGRGHKMLVPVLSSQLINLLSSPNVIPYPPTPTPYVIRAWWTSSTG